MLFLLLAQALGRHGGHKHRSKLPRPTPAFSPKPTRTPRPTYNSTEIEFLFDWSFLDMFNIFDDDLVAFVLTCAAAAGVLILFALGVALVWYFCIRRFRHTRVALNQMEEDAIPPIQERLLPPQPEQNVRASPAPQVLTSQSDYIVYWQARAAGPNNQSISLRIDVHARGTVLSNFRANYQFASGWRAEMEPGNTSVVVPTGPSYTQALYLFNPQNAPFEMHMNVSFVIAGQPKNHTIIVKSLPPFE